MNLPTFAASYTRKKNEVMSIHEAANYIIDSGCRIFADGFPRPFDTHSEELEELLRDFRKNGIGSPKDDKRSLMEDGKNVRRDIARSFGKIKEKYGQARD